jgi:hypothetical protein
MAQFVLGSFTFRTKGDAVKSVQHVLHNAPVGELLSGDDLNLVLALRDRHPHREDKLAGGMIGVAVLMNNEAICRADSISCGRTGRRKTLATAWRSTRRPSNARLAVGPQCCDVSGEPLTSLNMHVDHAGEWPFRRIVKEFVEWAVRERLSLRLVESGVYTVEFADPQVTEAFRAFHNARATLRRVTQEVNQRCEREGAGLRAASKEPVP